MRTSQSWANIGLRPHHGIALPLFSLHSHKSCGIGEFNDLLPLIDWCAELGLSVIQLLPLNDTGDDPSPYNAISSCALHPRYLSLSDLPHASNLPSELEQKLPWLHNYFLAHFTPTAEYKQFISEHNSWLLPYAAYKAKIDQRSPEFHQFVQHLCFKQLIGVHTYATQKHVFLKGDVPILISPASVDVEMHPHLFNLALEAGAPPDYYNPNGQHWGFPLFNWDAMRKDDFHWWKQRLHIASLFFDLYRIDHVVGLFRIWGIPRGLPPLQGYFVPADYTLWPLQGREVLEMMIDAAPILPLAEDLGTIPNEVRPMLKELGICSTKIIRWEKNWNGDKSYIPFDQYEPFSLTSVSTADSDTLTLWWKNSPEEAKAFAKFKGWTYEKELTREQRFELLKDSHHTSSLFHINLLQETLALFPELIWRDPEQERINIPGTVQPSNWTYRFRLRVEEMTEHRGLKEAFHLLID